MAAAAVEQRCLLQWHILNPFVPWQRMATTFYHGSPTLTVWNVTLEPDNKSIDFWNFKFSLNGIKTGDPDAIIATNRLEVNILINGERMNLKQKENYIFQRSNRHRYEFSAYAHTAPLRDRPHHLVVAVGIIFPRQDIASGNALYFDDADLIQLSDDLEGLFNLTSYSNLILNSTDVYRSFFVHSYIIHARWNNFYSVHHPINDNTVDTNISPAVLRGILRYVYSGKLDVVGPNGGNQAYMTEMFQVIDRYKLHHLYKVFAPDESQQERTTSKNLTIHSRDFRLDDNGEVVRVLSYRWDFNVGDDPFVFRIQFMLLSNNSYFQYYLESMSPRRMHTQVSLEFKMRFLENTRLKVNSVHQRDFTIRPNDTVQSGTCYFEGQTEELNAFISGRLTGRNMIQFYIRCTLYLSDGTSVTQIQNENVELLDDLERYKVLSDHMYELMGRTTQSNSTPTNPGDEPDFQILCREELPVYPEDPYFRFSLHKSIFEARVPEWRTILGSVVEEDNYPNTVILDIVSEAFLPVLTYIYTGKICPVFEHNLDEVDEFAERGGLNLLRNLVNRMRFDAQNL